MLKILAGDIGGTNTRLGIFTASDDRQTLTESGEAVDYKNKDYGGFEEILGDYLKRESSFTDVCVGVAGVILDGAARMTNLERWPTITCLNIAKRLDLSDVSRVNLINDMPAHAASLERLEKIPGQIVSIRQGKPAPHGSKTLIMPGTGLGTGLMIYDKFADLHRPIPTEGGHLDLSSRDPQIDALIVKMRALVSKKGEDRVTREMVVSGQGFPRIYEVLAPTNTTVPDGETLHKIESSDPIAKQTLDLFTRLLGELCANSAFAYLARGGVYLAGGIANSLKPRLQSRLFLDAFEQSGPQNLRGLIADVPVYLVQNTRTGLIGAANYATWVASGKA